MTTSPPIYSDGFTLESIIMASHDGGDKNSALTYNFWKNGTASTLTALPAIGGTAYANEIGRDDDGAKYFNGKISEIILYSPLLSPGETAAVQYYLASRYTDSVLPTVTGVTPLNGATNVAANTTLTATFSEDMDPATITVTTFTLNGVTGAVTYDPATRTATLTPSGILAGNTTYAAAITTAVKDLAGNALTSNYTWSFTTTALSQFNVTAQAAGTGAGSISSNPAGISVNYPPGTTGVSSFMQYSDLVLTANASSGSTVSWGNCAAAGGAAEGNGTSSSTCSFSNLNAAKTVTATYTLNTYTITATAGSGGTISPPGTTTVNYGDNQTYTISADTGYHITDVKVDNVSQGVISNYTFSGVTAYHTIEASFAIDTFTITGAVTVGGTGLPGVVMNGLPGNPLTDGDGIYSVTVSSGWTGRVTPLKAGYILNPVFLDYNTITANQTNQNYIGTLDTTPPVYYDQFSAPDIDAARWDSWEFVREIRDFSGQGNYSPRQPPMGHRLHRTVWN